MSSGGRDRKREIIRIRDNHTCQLCGKVWIKGTRRFDIHHKDCDKEKSLQTDNLEKEADNMTTLCHKCHLNLLEHRLTMLGNRKKQLSEEQRDELLLLLKNGVSSKEISKQFNITKQSVFKYRIKLKRG